MAIGQRRLALFLLLLVVGSELVDGRPGFLEKLTSALSGGSGNGGKKSKDSSDESGEGDGDVDEGKAKGYLAKFGYLLPASVQTAITDLKEAKNKINDAIKKFQEFAGLPATGKLDVKTKKKMRQPRCGLLDIQMLSSGGGSAFKWPKSEVTYAIVTDTHQMPHATVREAIRKAYGTWSAVVPLTFREVSSGENADIKVKFGSGNHGDPWPFDGPGGVLAHATMPTSGMLHFDEDERWTFMDAAKISRHFTDLLPVAIHEGGHTLGLEHSRNPKAIMAPFYQETVDSSGNYITPKLTSDDIQAIQQIYGSGRGRSASVGGGGGSTTRGRTHGKSGSFSGRHGSSGSSGWGGDPFGGLGGFGGFGSFGSGHGHTTGHTTSGHHTTGHSHGHSGGGGGGGGGLFDKLWDKWAAGGGLGGSGFSSSSHGHGHSSSSFGSLFGNRKR